MCESIEDYFSFIIFWWQLDVFFEEGKDSFSFVLKRTLRYDRLSNAFQGIVVGMMKLPSEQCSLLQPRSYHNNSTLFTSVSIIKWCQSTLVCFDLHFSGIIKIEIGVFVHFRRIPWINLRVAPFYRIHFWWIFSFYYNLSCSVSHNSGCFLFYILNQKCRFKHHLFAFILELARETAL